MVTINFPTSPSLDQTYTFGSRTWSWNGRSWIQVTTTTGAPGYTGSEGFTGSVGFDGSLGYAGSQGLVGYTGSEGFTGSVGYVGSGGLGYTGSVGTVGYTGSQGIKSVTMYQDGVLSIKGGTIRWYAPGDLTITSVIARISSTADAIITIVINKNSILAKTITIAAGQSKSTDTTPLSMVVDDYLTMDITTIGSDGSSTQGSGLSVLLNYILV